MCLLFKLFFSLEWSREPCSLGYCHQETAKFCNYGICIKMEMYVDVNLSATFCVCVIERKRMCVPRLCSVLSFFKMFFCFMTVYPGFLSSFTHPHIIPNSYLSVTENKKNISSEWRPESCTEVLWSNGVFYLWSATGSVLYFHYMENWNKIIQVWMDMKASKWWQFFNNG